MIDIKCPKCGSYDFDCYDISFNANYEMNWALCYCEDCGTQFNVKYVFDDIELED